MEDRFVEDNVRERLILSGTKELLDHGVSDFSLRRVALSAQVSCAAPYRHFKDKEELILEIIARMRGEWNLLCEQIYSLFGDCKKQLVIELCVAGVRFWNGGENFRSVLMSGFADTELEKFDLPIVKAIEEYGESVSQSAEENALLRYSVRALFYGTVMLISVSSEKIDVAINKIREKLERELK